jgi:proteasome beta subunit
MTLIVAIGCSDGVVLASESCSTDLDNRTKQPVEKIERIPGQPILWGGSGDSGLIGRIGEGLSGCPARPSLKSARKEFKARIIPEQRDSLASYVPYPGTQPPSATILLAGFQEGKPWILEISKSGGDTFYGEAYGNFAAIGSGGTFAHASFRPHLTKQRDLRAGKLHAFRIIDDAIEIAHFGLDRPIRIHTVSADGSALHVPPEELNAIKDSCEVWRNLERETVGRVLSPDLREEPTEEIPSP